VHVPLIVSIPRVTFDIDNYGATPLDRTRYNAQIANSEKMGNKVSSKYMVLDAGEIGVSNTDTEYIRKHRRTHSGTHVQRGYNKTTGNGALRSEKHCRVTDAIVELVDIFPTIADLAGVPIPICQTDGTGHQSRSGNVPARKEMANPCSEGITLLPLIKSTLGCQVRHTLLLHR